MVNIYTFCDKTLVGRCENLSAKFLCENLYKLNFKINSVNVLCNKYDYESLNFKSKNIYFLLMQKSSPVLNGYLANLCGAETKENLTLKTTVTNYFKMLNIPLDNSASLEWIIPENAVAITNPNGKTQGYLVKMAETTIFVLPNEFNQFKKIFDDCILDYLEKNYSINYKSETFKTFGLTEENIRSILLNEIKNKDHISISIFSKNLDNDVVIKAREDNQKFNEYVKVVFGKLEKFIYSVQNLSMEQKLQNELISQNIQVAFAGDSSICSLLEGNKEYLNRINQSIFLPNNNAIANYLGINNVSITSEVVYDIAVKLLQNKTSDLVVVSLVANNGANYQSYVAVGNKVKIDIYKNTFTGSGAEVLANISQTVKFYVIKRLSLKDIKTI